MGDLCERLRALSRFEHGDVSIGSEAADEIAQLRAELEQVREVASEAELNREGLKYAHAELRGARDRLAMVAKLATDRVPDWVFRAELRAILQSEVGNE